MLPAIEFVCVHTPTGCARRRMDSPTGMRPQEHFLVNGMLASHLHPHGVHLGSKGLSHGLNKCPLDTCLPLLCKGRPFESHLSPQNKKQAAPLVCLFFMAYTTLFDTISESATQNGKRCIR